jgi:cytochrome c553
MKFLLQAAAMLSLILTTPVMAAGDAAAGQAKAGLCAACHGVDGNSSVPMWPKLAGQHAGYTERQLRLIKSGARPVPEMMGISAGLSEQDMADLAAYYAGQTISPGAADPALVELGQRIYKAGIPKREVPSCMSCHGPAGEGNPLSGYPALAGQHATYTAKMLTRYENGELWGDEDEASRIMTQVSDTLLAEEIEALASYIQGLHQEAD